MTEPPDNSGDSSEDDVNTDEEDDDGGDVVDGVIKDFVERSKGLGPPEISTGIASLDRAIIGMRPKKTMVIAARPGMGKTALAAGLRRSVLKQDYVVLDFNLEMGKEEIGERELAYQANVNLRKVMAAKEVSSDEMARIVGTEGYQKRGMWWVYDTCFSMNEIVRKCRVAKRRAKKEGKKIGLVVIDYLQLMGDIGSEGRNQSISACSRMTKLLSKEIDCMVAVLSQLNRGCEYRDDKRPMLADLRDSGAIEQDADIVIFIYRDCVYHPTSPSDEAELILAKHRGGPLGTVRVRFNPRTTHFDEMPVLAPASLGGIRLPS